MDCLPPPLIAIQSCSLLTKTSSTKPFASFHFSNSLSFVVSSNRLVREASDNVKCSLHSSSSSSSSSQVEQIKELIADDVPEQVSREDDDSNSIETESHELLEWSTICNQVSRFASTSMGREICTRASIPFGKTQEESHELLEQTAAARLLAVPLDFSDIVDVSGILQSAIDGIVCNVYELSVLEKMLSATKRVSEQLHGLASSVSPSTMAKGRVRAGLFPLLSVMANANFCIPLANEIKESIDRVSLSILDTASPSLASTRAARRANMKKLESLLLEVGEMVVAAGGMDSVIITTRRARLCVSVRASHKHLLPGGIVLDLSNSGATMFMEPKTALDLNNNEVHLASKEKEEELAILRCLTEKLAAASPHIWNLLQKVTALDLACAKAGHANWFNAVKPVFQSESFVATKEEKHACKYINTFPLDIEGLSHPLLLGPILDTLKSQIPTNKILPVPIDLKVKPDVSVVVISGPNTGGKTASMKTLGVAVLMAKAGLFLPANGKAILPWFDKVLADIGDSQSLEKSLSTFSGHIRRVCRIMEAGTCQSLILLDELGSGTDPSEGAALAAAILDHMAENVQLTIATTHFTQLSNFRDKRFDVASVEFDIETLRPKFNVLWGVAGQSNALNIADSLGIEEGILVRARLWMQKLAIEDQERRANQLMGPLMEQRSTLQTRAEVAISTAADARKLYNELAEETDGLEMRVAALRLQQEQHIKREIEIAKSRFDDIISSFESGKSISIRQALSDIASVVEAHASKHEDSYKDVKLGMVERPSVGDFVLIKRLGKNLATVIEAPSENDESFLVQLGNLKLRAKLSEVTKIVRQVTNPDQKRSKKEVLQIPVESPAIEFHNAAIQTSRNTVDLRGMYVEDALMNLEIALRKRRRSILFVVHGEGTGTLRAAVLKELMRHPLVSKFEQESLVNYGCTVVYTK